MQRYRRCVGNVRGMSLVPAGAERRVAAWTLSAIALQAIFPIAWLVAGALDHGYSHDREYVSELAALGQPHRWIVTAGIVALGLSWLALALALRPALRDRRLGWLPAALFAAVAALTVASALMPLDCVGSIDHVCRHRERHWQLSWHHYGHGFAAWVIQLLLAATPFAFAVVFRPGVLSRVALGAGVIGLAIGAGVGVAQAGYSPHAGIYQRAGLVVVHGWTYLICAALLVAAYLQTARPRTA